MASAKILGNDSVLGGNWLGRCGRSGYWISISENNNLESLPTWLTVSLESSLAWFTSANPTNLQTPDGSGYLTRLPRSAVNAAGSIVSFKITASQPCVISLYSGGFNDVLRSGEVTWLNLDDEILDTASVVHSGGLWTRAVVDGEVRLKITQLDSPSFYISGLFFDPRRGFSGFDPGLFGNSVF